MENASKALMIAGGILIALMILGALLLMFTQISSYQKRNADSEKNAQIATFNQDFAKYADEKSLKGVEIISLANKVVDYNQKNGITNYIDYEKKITLNVKLTGFATGSRSELFGRTTSYTITDSSNDFVKAIKKFSDLEKKYTLASMGMLKSNYNNILSGAKTILEVTGKNMPEITINDIAKYIEYTELKSSKFKPSEAPKYQDGQIVGLSFEFVKK